MAEAADFHEVFDLDKSSFFADDGTVIEASADGYQVRLRVTDAVDRPELLRRLRDFSERADRRIDSSSADDPMAYARAFREPGWHRQNRA
jgi:hypothetical protein